ncbi:hypothetical protein PR202_ga04676 [Eleusine coracana subsp. coracana]|uniref:Uncharacterized protein n=1 Tax=Eleusine coracana subsp. coracana TaxID=191504 RepID=A0AAV5BSL8_ELECO|nr:hypothetical protein PR202_ga04676 [Eleusine coracana subsp. coracana]
MEVGWLVCPIIKIVIDKARSCASERIKWMGSGSVGEALNQVEQMLVQLSTVADAVEKRTSTGTSADLLRAWLQQLKDAVYNADDVLDDFDGSAPQPGSYVATVGRRILGTDEPLNRLKEVLKTLEAVRASSDKLMQVVQLVASGPGELSGHQTPHGRVTGSVCHQELLGRDRQLREMVAWLVDPSDGDAQTMSVPIAAIMGHGGMGKTKLAQTLFNDQTVVSTFDLRIWVQPSAIDGEFELAKQILQSADVDVPRGMGSFDWLQQKLIETISSHKFLLVIDNVWNIENMAELEYREMWSKVLEPIMNQGKKTESKIVLTTRQRIVARLLCASKEVWMKSLPADDIWSLLKRCAFGEEDIEKQHPVLWNIGKEIAQKLKGSPMAAKAIGQMLRGNHSVTHWSKVLLETKSFENVSSTLELCYHNLPDHLQPCFAICSIFPKNTRFKRDKLVRIWMALDFIQTAEREARLEDVGSGYFDQLVDRSFFHKQKVGRRRRYYYIHDLMHDLAEQVSRFDCMRVEGINQAIPKTVRHLSVSSGGAMEQLKSLCELKRLRTLVILNNPSSSLDQLPGDLFTELKGLRVLCLERSSIANLSEKISHLKHLRYLALCKSTTRLPHIVTKLYRLQTLRSPKESCLEGIPKDITNLNVCGIWIWIHQKSLVLENWFTFKVQLNSMLKMKGGIL